MHQKEPERTYVPSFESFVKAERRRMGPIKPKAGDGPWPDATSIWHGRHGCSSDGESHAS